MINDCCRSENEYYYNSFEILVLAITNTQSEITSDSENIKKLNNSSLKMQQLQLQI